MLTPLLFTFFLKNQYATFSFERKAHYLLFFLIKKVTNLPAGRQGKAHRQ